MHLKSLFWVSFFHFQVQGHLLSLETSSLSLAIHRFCLFCFSFAKHSQVFWVSCKFYLPGDFTFSHEKLYQWMTISNLFLQLVHDYTDYWTTSLSENAQYVRFRGWWDELGVTGLIPFIALLFFNVCIYRKIR